MCPTYDLSFCTECDDRDWSHSRAELASKAQPGVESQSGKDRECSVRKVKI